MDVHHAYAHCVRCGAPTTPRENFVECTVCKHRLYLNPAPCNAVIVKQTGEKVLLVKRKFEPRKDTWDLPGGFVDIGEDLNQSVKREMQEELHVQVQIERIVGIYSGVYTFQDIEMPTFGVVVVATILGGKMQLDDDVSDMVWATKDEIQKLDISFPPIERGLKDFFSTENSWPS